jgi:hypothetical protein
MTTFLERKTAMTPNRIVRRLLQGAVFAAAINATALAQTAARPVFNTLAEIPHAAPPVKPAMLQEELGLLLQPAAMPTSNPVGLTGLAGDTTPSAPRPDQRLLIAGQDGFHASFVTPIAARESEQLRVQGSLAVLSAFISQRNASRVSRGPIETPGPACIAGR